MWRITTKKIWTLLYDQYSDDLELRESHASLIGDNPDPIKRHFFVMNVYGFKKAKHPFIKIENIKEHPSDKEWNHNYFIYYK